MTFCLAQRSSAQRRRRWSYLDEHTMPRFSKKVIGTVDAAGDDVNAYEAERAARIEENKRRMMALGIFDLSLIHI